MTQDLREDRNGIIFREKSLPPSVGTIKKLLKPLKQYPGIAIDRLPRRQQRHAAIGERTQAGRHLADSVESHGRLLNQAILNDLGAIAIYLEGLSSLSEKGL